MAERMARGGAHQQVDALVVRPSADEEEQPRVGPRLQPELRLRRRLARRLVRAQPFAPLGRDRPLGEVHRVGVADHGQSREQRLVGRQLGRVAVAHGAHSLAALRGAHVLCRRLEQVERTVVLGEAAQPPPAEARPRRGERVGGGVGIGATPGGGAARGERRLLDGARPSASTHAPHSAGESGRPSEPWKAAL